MTSSATDLRELSTAIGGDVVVPGSPEYDVVRHPAMARFHEVRPAAIVRCMTPADASAAILFARRTGLPLALRCGGHSVAVRATSEGVVIDVTPMRSVTIKDGLAIVGAGARLGELYEALFAHGARDRRTHARRRDRGARSQVRAHL